MSRGRPRRAGPLVLTLLVCLAVLPGGAGLEGAGDGRTVYGVDVDPDTILMQADVGADGTASWLVEYWIRLDDEASTTAFAEHRETIQTDPGTYREAFAEDMAGTVDTAAGATDRSMDLGAVEVNATRRSLPQEYGVISYTFEWAGFAAADDGRLEVGDAIAGLFLDEETSLLLRWPVTHEATTVSPTPDDRRERGAVWAGARHFGSEEPHVVLTPADGTASGAGDGGPLEGMTAPVSAPVAVGLGAAVLAGVAGALYTGLRRRPAADAGDPAEAGESADLLSNEERVTALLEDHEGRMKQQAIADELGWTDAKTSKVVRRMREDGTVETFRLGRENVVALPGTGPTNDG